MNKTMLSFLSVFIGWTAGFLVFSFTEPWIFLIGWAVLFIGSFVLMYYFCDNANHRKGELEEKS